ncbi:MAG: TonB-dependent receptor [Prevotellaceae bacterium]|jgi:iron complex outermembrane receptor protein|nr:TonB-dependent receptor [Prevotellaceae bacterium]
MRTFLFVIPALCLFSTAMQAQDTIADNRRKLQEVVVSATRTEVNRHNVPMTISVVSREELEQSSESNILSGLADWVPGMFVTERGVTGFGLGAGGGGGITLRGVGGSPTTQALMLVNGQPQFMGIMGHHLPDSYVSSDVEKVEVVRGPASILYGSNAMGGVINIITRKQTVEGLHANARVMYGSYNTQKYMGNAGIRKGDFDAFVSLNHDYTDGHRERSAFRITNGYARAGYRLSNHFNVWGDVMLAKNTAHDPGATDDPMFDYTGDILRGMTSLTLQNDFTKSDGAFKLFYNFGDHEINDGYRPGESPLNYRYRSTDYNLGTSLYQTLQPLDGNLITIGLDMMKYGGNARNTFLDPRPDEVIKDTSLYSIAGYLHAQQILFDKLTLSAGLRYEYHKTCGSEWTPQAGLAFRPSETTTIKASVAKGFRNPSIRELFLWAPANPDLQPERMTHYEIAVEQSVLSGRMHVELTGYVADGLNLIQMEGQYPNVKNRNTGAFTNRGMEFAVRWNASESLWLQGHYSYLYMKTPLLYAPKHQFFIAANYRLANWQFSANYRFVDGLYIDAVDDPHPLQETFGTLNARVSFRILNRLSFFIKGENLTDRRYEILRGYPMPGITAFAGATIELGI